MCIRKREIIMMGEWAKSISINHSNFLVGELSMMIEDQIIHEYWRKKKHGKRKCVKVSTHSRRKRSPSKMIGKKDIKCPIQTTQKIGGIQNPNS